MADRNTIPGSRQHQSPAGAEELEWDKLVREGMEKLLPRKVKDEEAIQCMKKLKLKPTYANAIALSLMEKAAGGDLSAAKFVRELMGDRPPEKPSSDTLGKELRQLDLSRLSDAQLEELADRLEEDEEAEP